MSSPSATKVAHLPELLVLIGSFLDPPDLLECVQVSRLWNHHLIPVLWQTIDDSKYSLFEMVNMNSHGASSQETMRQIQSIFDTYGRHTRHLHLHMDRTIWAASIAGTCTRLKSLSVSRIPRHICVGLTSGDLPRPLNRNHSDPYSNCLISPLLEDLPRPNSPPTTESLIDWIVRQRSWLLILENTSLNSLELEGSWTLCPSRTTQFLIKTLSSLQKLTRLKNAAAPLSFQTPFELCPTLQHYECDTHLDNNDIHFTTIFSHVLTLSTRHSRLRMSALFNLLLHLPNIEQLTLNHVMLPHSPDWSSGIALEIYSSQPKELHFSNTDLSLAESLNLALSEHILSWLPHLKALSMKVLESRVTAALTKFCPLLESLKLSAVLTDPCDVNTASTPLHNCPSLRILDTIRYSIDAELLLERPIVCRSLETFRCRILGIIRLTAAEENLRAK